MQVAIKHKIKCKFMFIAYLLIAITGYYIAIGAIVFVVQFINPIALLRGGV